MFFMRMKIRRQFWQKKKLSEISYGKNMQKVLLIKILYAMWYHVGINGWGHYCFFDNKSDDLLDYIETLKLLLPEEFYRTFYNAYEVHVNNQDVENMCDLTDDYFYQKEQVVIDILQEYADGLDDSSNG